MLYHYENALFPNHLTGISYVETNGSITRYATYSYNASGKAISTELAGGAERFTLSYDTATQTTVRDAVLNPEVMTFSSNLGIKNLVSKVNGSDGKSLVQAFDANNNLTCKKDEEGRVVTYTYNATNQRVSMTEGIVGSCSSPQTTSATRTTTYSYVSPTLDAPTVIQTPSVQAGSSKRTTLVYGDTRFPTLPTGITQSGFTPAGTAVSRTVGLSYNASGQVTAIDGPRTDVNDITTLAYYSCTTGGACGQLASVTNAAGHVTTYDRYDGAGRLLQLTDPNGLRTQYAYDARGRVTSVTQTPPGGTGRTTSFAYNAAGNVTFTGLPDGRTLTYSYNAAQQLLGVVDNLGHRVTYGYDLKGNRTQEYTYDPDSTLVRAIDTAYNLRNHVREINHGGSITQQVTDALGNLARVADPNQVAANSGIATQHGYDALNRLTQTLDNLNGSTNYGYNAHDKLTQVSAPNGAVTQYVYDDLGNLLSETSPDRGTMTYTYDAAGNVISQTDARGITTGYTYDALNRIVGINYPTDPDVSYAYDSGNACTSGIGRLCQVTDAAGTTQYGYDAFGNVTTQIKTELGRSYTTTYGYDPAHRVTSITYPDNRVVSYGRDGIGRIASVTTTVNGVATVIASNRTYRADGLLLGQSYGNGINEVRTYDTQGRLTYQSLGGADTRVYEYDANGNLTRKQSLPEVASYGYDVLDRLVADAGASLTADFGYDANGNRLSDARGSYAYLAATNRLATAPDGAIVLDAAGHLLSDGARSFTYNAAGQLASVVDAGSYLYDHRNLRTRKTTALGTVVYHHDLQGRLLLETTEQGLPLKTYLWAEDQPLAQIDVTPAGEVLAYLHADHLATPRLATDGRQRVVWSWEGEAFGSSLPNDDPDGDGVATIINLRFAGQYYDGETGLFYNWNRYYSPQLGRYISSDPIGVGEHVQFWQENLGIPGEPPLEINPYAALANNPLKWIDPDGMRSTSAGGARSGGGRSGGSRSGSESRSSPGMSINEGNKALLGLIELLDPPKNPPGCVISFEYECSNNPHDDGTQCPAYPRQEAWPAGHSKPLTCLKPRMVVRCR